MGRDYPTKGEKSASSLFFPFPVVQRWKVREAITGIERQFPSRHPLADQQFVTNGIDRFIEKYGQLITISQAGQLAMRAVLQAHLRRIDRDPSGVPLKLYPFTRTHHPDKPRAVVIDPYVSFGRPVLVGTGIPATIIAERYKAAGNRSML